jgi:hypothetical protein
MSRDFLLKHIAEAERHVHEAEHSIQQHHELIAQLRENGQDTMLAERLLYITVGFLEAHERHLAYLRNLLAR